MARFKFEFWLDADKDNELLLMEDIDGLKRNRLFSKTIRDGIRLIMDLRKGNLDVLVELFPQFKSRIRAADDTSRAGGDEASVNEKLDRLESILLQNIEPSGLLMNAKKTVTGGPKSLTAPSFDLPTFDDDDDEFAQLVTKRKTNPDEIIKNFLGAVGGLT